MAALLREAVRQRWVNRLFEAIANPRGCTSVIGTTTPGCTGGVDAAPRR